jgi:hypothetical protein
MKVHVTYNVAFDQRDHQQKICNATLVLKKYVGIKSTLIRILFCNISIGLLRRKKW